MIFYFSGTGNTEWTAKTLANALQDELVWIPDALKSDCHYTVKEGERVGFCFPVHGWRPPLLVRKFISKLHIQQTAFTYAVVTAGDNIGETIDILESDLSSRGIILDSAYSLIMPESYVGLPFMDVDRLEKEHVKKQKAAEDLERFIPEILEKKQGIRNLTIGRWPRINSRIIGSFFLNHLITDKPFHVHADKCLRCGKCQDVCPVDNITGGKGSIPEWKHNSECLTCFACYHHCPVHAIEFGQRTKNKGQYYYHKNQ